MKVDPLALVQTIEHYLMLPKCEKIRDAESMASEEENSEEDADDRLVSYLLLKIFITNRNSVSFSMLIIIFFSSRVRINIQGSIKSNC